MRVCPKCNLPYPNGIERCVRDQSPLSALQDFIEDNAPLVRGNLIGELVGNYKIIKKLGSGAMGTVYQATHISIGKEVAVKILNENCAQNEQILERFYQEARSLAKLNHENIVQILDFGCTGDGLAYLVTELLIGQSLDDLLNKEKTFPPARAIAIASQICRGLEAAHQFKIIHRDLKPENIHLVRFADNNDFAKLLDFGIAKQLNSNTAAAGLTKAFIGTPAYMPPEQAHETDERSDIYSVGVILYQMLSGVVPFDGANMVDVLYKHLTEPPKPLVQHDPKIPKQLDEIVQRCLAKQKDQRFSSAKELHQALRSLDLERLEAESLEDSPTEAVDVDLRALPTHANPIQPTAKAANKVIFSTTLSGGTGELKSLPPPKKNTLLYGSLGALAFTGIVGFVLFSGPTQQAEQLIAAAKPVVAPVVVPTKEPTKIEEPQTQAVATQPAVEPIQEPATEPTKAPVEPVKAVETPRKNETPKNPISKPKDPKIDPLGKPKGSLD
jgi:serine/threonine protein kinase